MGSPLIKTWLTDHLCRVFPDRVVRSNYTDGSSHMRYANRYIQVSVSGLGPEVGKIHYEYDGYAVWLHIESEYQNSEYRDFRRLLRRQTDGNPNLRWDRWQNHPSCRCGLTCAPPDSVGGIVECFKALMAVFDPLVCRALGEAPSVGKLLNARTFPETAPDFRGRIASASPASPDGVGFVDASLADLFSCPLSIPTYQRDYCWDDSDISRLWDTLAESAGEVYLGNVILQQRGGRFDIIDGQQRLITLTLMAMAMGWQKPLSLARAQICSRDSIDNIANAKAVVADLARGGNRVVARLLADGADIRMGVLILGPETDADLAYTFFAANNSKGLPLTDFDLLKAHHLQFVDNDDVAGRLASEWDVMTGGGASPAGGRRLQTLMGHHLLNLRKWMRFDVAPKTPHAVRDEFVAALRMASLPSGPSDGADVGFYDKIGGGERFFGYVSRMSLRYDNFLATDTLRAFSSELCYSSHIHYHLAIEALLFGYYLKFGDRNMPEALFCISSIVAADRYLHLRMRRDRLMATARDSRVIMMVDQATAPTFFLAEALAAIMVNPLSLDEDNLSGIRRQFYMGLQSVFRQLLPLVEDESIRIKISDVYEL